MTVLDLAELHTLRDALIRARLNGLRELVDQNGERIAFKSDTEMRNALDAVSREIQSRQNRSPHTIHFRTSKGV